jgi:hypothetical protein
MSINPPPIPPPPIPTQRRRQLLTFPCGGTKTRMVYLAMAILCFSLSISLWILPFSPSVPESTLAGSTVFLGFGLVLYWAALSFIGSVTIQPPDYPAAAVLAFLTLGCAFVTGISATFRGDAASQIAAEFEGVVAKKYVEGNRGGCLILDGHGTNVNSSAGGMWGQQRQTADGFVYEGVNWPVWQEVQIGDHIQKEAFSPYAQINGKRVIFVEPRHWIGPRGWRLRGQ